MVSSYDVTRSPLRCGMAGSASRRPGHHYIWSTFRRKLKLKAIPARALLHRCMGSTGESVERPDGRSEVRLQYECELLVGVLHRFSAAMAGTTMGGSRLASKVDKKARAESELSGAQSPSKVQKSRTQSWKAQGPNPHVMRFPQRHGWPGWPASHWTVAQSTGSSSALFSLWPNFPPSCRAVGPHLPSCVFAAAVACGVTECSSLSPSPSPLFSILRRRAVTAGHTKRRNEETRIGCGSIGAHWAAGECVCVRGCVLANCWHACSCRLVSHVVSKFTHIVTAGQPTTRARHVAHHPAESSRGHTAGTPHCEHACSRLVERRERMERAAEQGEAVLLPPSHPVRQHWPPPIAPSCVMPTNIIIFLALFSSFPVTLQQDPVTSILHSFLFFSCILLCPHRTRLLRPSQPPSPACSSIQPMHARVFYVCPLKPSARIIAWAILCWGRPK